VAKVSVSSGSEIFTDHTVLIEQVLVPDLDRVKLFFKLSNILFLSHFHLLEDFFLGVELSVQIFSFGYSFVDLVLEFQVLFLQDLNLTV